MSPNVYELKRIAHDTIDRTPAILDSTPGASADSTFYDDQTCQALHVGQTSRPDPPHGPSAAKVLNSDAFTLARKIIQGDRTAEGKIAVLNLASDELPAGGLAVLDLASDQFPADLLETLCKTQEEALCYSSTLYKTLRPEWYPWPNLGPHSVAGIYSPAVVVFKDALDHDCVDLAVEERVVISVITVAAPRWPKLNQDQSKFENPSDTEDLRGKIRLVLRMAARDGKDRLVLGAMGCGAYGCPPMFVAKEMKNILLDDEFKGWFKEVLFAIYSSRSNGPSNFQIFNDMYRDLRINL